MRVGRVGLADILQLVQLLASYVQKAATSALQDRYGVCRGRTLSPDLGTTVLLQAVHCRFLPVQDWNGRIS
jgi:hypothetical protein